MAEWDRQKGEPTEWYTKFKIFLNLGPKRSVVDAWAEWKLLAKSKKITSEKPAPEWYQHCAKYQWVERASAYDQAQLEIIRQMYATQFIQARTRHTKLARCMFNKAMRAIKSLDAANISAADAAKWVDMACKLEKDALRDLELDSMSQLVEELEKANGNDTRTAAEVQGTASASGSTTH